MKHLLVTNDFPPKVGGIQTYLWELWRRLPPDDVTVLARLESPDDLAWDAAQPFPVERWKAPILAPTPGLRRRVDELADRSGAQLVVFDPVSPTSLLGLGLDRPYGIVAHGAEVTVAACTPGYQLLIRRALREASVVVAGGRWAAGEARAAAGRPLPTVVVPPGVDHRRFRPLDDEARRAARRRLGLDPEGSLVVSVSRLVPRKGMDVLIQAVAHLAQRRPDLQLAIAGDGRDRGRLDGLIAGLGAPARLLGRVPDGDLPDLYAAADVFAMLCRNRWLGIEQEGFGIVFLEAAAAGVPVLAGASGGSAEAVVDGETGLVVDHPADVEGVVDALGGLLDDPARRRSMGEAARRRASTAFDQDELARHLHDGLGRAVAGELEAWSPASPRRP